MNANELMTGDWVRCTDPKPFRIEQIDGIEELVYGDDGFFVDTADLQPIPLTKEILKKNWFKVRNMYIWEWRDNYCCAKVKFAHKIGIDGETFDEPPILLQIDTHINSLNIIVEYVHELQHALRMCGFEKDIII